jgi:CBS domain-containing protein
MTMLANSGQYEYASTLRQVRVSDWITKDVVAITSNTPIAQAHQMMKDHGIRRLVVCDNDKITGIVTLGDVREASASSATSLSIWELNYLWAQLTVAGVMTRNVYTVHDDETIIDAARLMMVKKVSGLPVVNDAGNLVGIITESDIFRMLVMLAAESA